MRANLVACCLACCAACVLLTVPSEASPAPGSADDAASMNIEALSDREPERWQGRHHYLYDNENQPSKQPSPATTGSAPRDGRNCASEPVRMRRSDGSTVVRWIRRCD